MSICLDNKRIKTKINEDYFLVKLVYKATTGWFANFKRKPDIKHVLMHWKSVSADKVERYHSSFNNLFKALGALYPNIHWKPLLNRIYIVS